MKFSEIGNVTDNFPELVPSLAPWQAPEPKYNITASQAVKLGGLFAALGTNFEAGMIAAAPGSGVAQAPYIPVELAQNGFEAAGFPSARVHYQQEVRVHARDGWHDVIVDLGLILVRLNTPGVSASAKVAGIMSDLNGQISAAGVDLTMSEPEFLAQIEAVSWAIEQTCASIISRYRV